MAFGGNQHFGSEVYPARCAISCFGLHLVHRHLGGTNTSEARYTPHVVPFHASACTSGGDSVGGGGLDLAPKLKRGISNSIKHYNDADCRAALHQHRPDVKDYDLLIKCWQFDYSLTNNGEHLGTHTDMIRSVCEHDNMKPVVEKCRKRIKELLKQQDIVRVACVDDHGRHRSVAVAKILQAICKMNGYKTRGAFHMERHRWSPKRICLDCEHCRPNNAKANLYTTYATYWRE